MHFSECHLLSQISDSLQQFAVAVVFFHLAFSYSFSSHQSVLFHRRLHQVVPRRNFFDSDFSFYFCMMQCLEGVSCRTIEASVPSQRVLPRTDRRTRQEFLPVWLCLTQQHWEGNTANLQIFSRLIPNPRLPLTVSLLLLRSLFLSDKSLLLNLKHIEKICGECSR